MQKGATTVIDHPVRRRQAPAPKAARQAVAMFHIVAKNDVWKVYDRDQKFRCAFHSQAEAQAYVVEHTDPGRGQ